MPGGHRGRAGRTGWCRRWKDEEVEERKGGERRRRRRAEARGRQTVKRRSRDGE